MPVRVALADDHTLFIDAVEKLLAESAEVEVVGKASKVETTISMVETQRPDVLVLDLMMPGGGGAEVLHRLASQGLQVPTLVLTGTEDSTALSRVLDGGARGFITKTRSGAHLVEGVLAVHAGRTYIDATLDAGGLAGAGGAGVSDRSAGGAGGEADDDGLSERERQVLRRISYGYTNKEIANQLGLSVKTVEGYRARVSGKLGAASRADLVAAAIELGLMRGERPI